MRSTRFRFPNLVSLECIIVGSTVCLSVRSQIGCGNKRKNYVILPTDLCLCSPCLLVSSLTIQPCRWIIMTQVCIDLRFWRRRERTNQRERIQYAWRLQSYLKRRKSESLLYCRGNTKNIHSFQFDNAQLSFDEIE